MAVNGGKENSYIWCVDDVYKTLAKSATAYFKDRGSKFIAYAFEVSSLKDIQLHLMHIKEEHASATHHCFAWRIGVKGEQYRTYDDGEPAGTAGRPIYDAIRSIGLTNTLVIVVRYFGGTQLGKTGLIQAYKEASIACLKDAGVCEKTINTIHKILFPYKYMNAVMSEIKKSGCNLLKIETTENVEVTVEIRTSLSKQFLESIIDKTQSSVKIE